MYLCMTMFKYFMYVCIHTTYVQTYNYTFIQHKCKNTYIHSNHTTYIQTYNYTFIQHKCKNTYIHTYINTNIHTYKHTSNI